MAPRAQKVKEDLTDKLDKLLQEGDPLLAAAMLMGGTAAAAGLTPPLMRLMKATANADLDDFDDMAKAAAAFAGGLVPGLLFLGYKLGGSGEAPEEPGAKETVACFCEGAVEVYLMSKLFGNPEFMKMLMGVAEKGAGLLGSVATKAPMF